MLPGVLIAGAAGGAAALAGAAAWFAGAPGPAAAAAGAAAAASSGALGLAFDRLAFAPARRLARGLRAVRESRSADAALPATAAPLLRELAAEADAAATALRVARRDVRKAAAAEAARVDAQKSWLETILQGLTEGVFVCSLQHRILLYNAAAVTLTGAPERCGLGRSIGDLIGLAALRHSLGRLAARHADDPDAPAELSAPFVCTSVEGGRMLHGRMALVSDPGGAVAGYLVTLVDISGELALLAKGDGVRRALTRDLRGMVGNLRAAAETVAAFPDMAPSDRAAFEAVVLDESERISAKLDELGAEIRGHMLGRWPMADIYVVDLVKLLEPALAERGLEVTLVGLPLWLHGDSLALLRAIERLVTLVHEATGATRFDLEPLLGDRRVYLDLVWEGAPIAAGALEAWLDGPSGVEDGADAGGERLRDVLERHGSEPWSKAAGLAGHALLRLPLLAPNRPQFVPQARRLPARPEFYDFGLMRAHLGDASQRATRLSDLEFVVFDCETTGLHPGGGDEIIQIGAVRVVQGRLLTGEGFERLVNPGRPIPPGSIKFHGLTDADVAGKPSIREVLPEFRAFVGDAVMVGHNAAFDMKFLSLKQRAAGVAFDNPVLDTMLVSFMLDGTEETHSLDALCDRYGITVTGRHTALGDTIATAELLLRLIERLEAKGLTTFGQVMDASNMEAELRHRGAIFAHGAGGG